MQLKNRIFVNKLYLHTKKNIQRTEQIPIIILHIFVPLFMGILIYFFWRNLNLLIPFQENLIRFEIVNAPNWVKYNLPDGLWLYALLSSITIIWGGYPSIQLILWLFSTIILSYISEAFQAIHFIQGTFDWKDCFAYFLALIFFLYNFRHINITNYQNLLNEND